MHFPGIWRSKFTDFAGKKHNLWEKTAADKSAWIKACHQLDQSQVKGKNSAGKNFQSSSVRKENVDIAILKHLGFMKQKLYNFLQ